MYMLATLNGLYRICVYVKNIKLENGSRICEKLTKKGWIGEGRGRVDVT